MAKPKSDKVVELHPGKTERNGPSHEQIQMAVHSMLEWLEKRNQINAAITKFRKGLKADGFTLSILDDKIKKLEWSPEEFLRHKAEDDHYSEALRFPVGTQLEMFGGINTPEPVKEQLKWRNVGYKRGLAGIGWPDDTPAGCPPECVGEYAKGHEEGSEIVRAAFLKRQQELGPVDNPYVKDDEAGEPGAPTEDEAEFAEVD